MRRVGVVGVLLVLAVAIYGDEAPHASFTCRAFGEKQFCCVARGVDGFTPEWRIYAGAEVVPDRANGQSVCFGAPLEWRSFEMRVDDDAGTTHLIRALVRRDVGKHTVIFTTGDTAP